MVCPEHQVYVGLLQQPFISSADPAEDSSLEAFFSSTDEDVYLVNDECQDKSGSSMEDSGMAAPAEDSDGGSPTGADEGVKEDMQDWWDDLHWAEQEALDECSEAIRDPDEMDTTNEQVSLGIDLLDRMGSEMDFTAGDAGFAQTPVQYCTPIENSPVLPKLNFESEDTGDSNEAKLSTPELYAAILALAEGDQTTTTGQLDNGLLDFAASNGPDEDQNNGLGISGTFDSPHDPQTGSPSELNAELGQQSYWTPEQLEQDLAQRASEMFSPPTVPFGPPIYPQPPQGYAPVQPQPLRVSPANPRSTMHSQHYIGAPIHPYARPGRFNRSVPSSSMYAAPQYGVINGGSGPVQLQCMPPQPRLAHPTGFQPLLPRARNNIRDPNNGQLRGTRLVTAAGGQPYTVPFQHPSAISRPQRPRDYSRSGIQPPSNPKDPNGLLGGRQLAPGPDGRLQLMTPPPPPPPTSPSVNTPGLTPMSPHEGLDRAPSNPGRPHRRPSPAPGTPSEGMAPQSMTPPTGGQGEGHGTSAPPPPGTVVPGEYLVQ